MSGDAPPAGTLYVVSTPIGNLGDLSPRAVEVLRGVAAILAEDTRHTRILCDRFAIGTPLLAYHEHNEAAATPGLLARLQGGASLALVSDAGTPIVSDPGARLVRSAVDAGIAVSPVPGASAVLAGLVASGLATDRFTFFGFLPRKGADRADALDDVVGCPHPAVLYEAPSRVQRLLADLDERGAGARRAAAARELTKAFEEIRRGTVAELAAYYSDHDVRGEVVIVIEGAPQESVDVATLAARAQALRASGLTAREVQRALQAQGAARNLAYRLAHEA